MKHSHLIQSLCPKIRHIRRNLYWTPFPKPSKKAAVKITAAFSLCCLIFIQQYLTNIIHTFAFTGIILQRSNTFRPAKRTLPKLPQDLLRTFRPHLLPLLQSILSPLNRIDYRTAIQSRKKRFCFFHVFFSSMTSGITRIPATLVSFSHCHIRMSGRDHDLIDTVHII